MATKSDKSHYETQYKKDYEEEYDMPFVDWVAEKRTGYFSYREGFDLTF